MECDKRDEFVQRLTAVEAHAESIDRRLEEVVQQQNTLADMATSMAVMAEKQSSMADKLEAVDAKVSTLECEPGKKWESVTSEVVKWAVLLILGFIAVKLGLK